MAYNLMPSFMKGLRSRPCHCRPSQVSSGRQSFGQKRAWLLFLTRSYTTWVFSHLHFLLHRVNALTIAKWGHSGSDGISACPAVCLALSHMCTLPPTHLDRLDVLRNRPRLPGLTVASEVPGIITDYDCSSWLNGKRPAKRRETKIWLIMAHSCEQLHTIRTDSLEERHGRERNWKAEKKWQNHSIPQLYKCNIMHWR